MSLHKKSLMVLFMALAVVIAGCGKKTAEPLSVMETSEYHYNQGLKYLDKDQSDDALKEFDRAISLDPRSPLGYMGKGFALGKKNEYKPARENMSTAKGLDKGIDAAIGMIRLSSMQRAGGWVVDVEDEFTAALKKEPDSARLWHYMGMAYKAALDFDRAAEKFRKVLDMNKEFTAEANAELAVIQKAQLAAPGTEIGKKIALIDKIDRADVAALFDLEMNLEKLFAKRGSKNNDTSFKTPSGTNTKMNTETTTKIEPASDIADHWLKPSMDLIMKLRVRGLEAGQDHKFEPDNLITKGEFALMLEDILIKVNGDEKLATKFFGATSPFPDVRNDHYAFNAIMTATSRGFLEADKATGVFRPTDPVSGADALLTIREFKNQLKF